MLQKWLTPFLILLLFIMFIVLSYVEMKATEVPQEYKTANPSLFHLNK